MVERIWLLARRYWFDALVVAGAIEALVELFTRQGDKNAPTSSLWILAPLLVAGILPLLARRWFPFGAPAAVFLINAVVSFIDGRVVTLTAATFLTVLVSAFLFGMLEHRTQAVAGLAIGLAAGAFLAAGFLVVQRHGFDLFDRFSRVLGRGWAEKTSAGAAAPMTYLPNPKLVPLPMCTTSPRRSRSRKGCRSPRYVTRPTNPPSFMRASWRAE